MHHQRPSRLRGFGYTGHHRYLLTICARRPAKPFRRGRAVRFVLEQLRQRVSDGPFALLAFCFMPDHAHLVVEGLSEQADLCRFIARWKQESGYWYRRETGRALWMSGYYDRILRDGESTMDAVRYVVMNPIRARLAKQVGEYPFAGSDVFSDQELKEVLKGCR